MHVGIASWNTFSAIAECWL